MQRRSRHAANLPLVDHREYVGGLWDEIGRLQFDFLVAQGLRPEHTLVDVACGSLRGGVHFVPYLDRGHYLGIDRQRSLIDQGRAKELGLELEAERRPEFVVSETFEFDRFSRRADWGIAQSLFTHLPARTIVDCLAKLRAWSPGCHFYATFLEAVTRTENPRYPHDHECFYYTRAEMQGFAHRTGWRFAYIGDWQHPRGQIMTLFS